MWPQQLHGWWLGRRTGVQIPTLLTPAPTAEDKAAIVIQCAFRQYLARRELARRCQERQEYLDEMEKLQKEVSRVQLQDLECQDPSKREGLDREWRNVVTLGL